MKAQIKFKLIQILSNIQKSLERVSKGQNPIKDLQKAGDELIRNELGMPGYGQIFLKENGSGEVWYVGGDGDEREFEDVVKGRLQKITGIDEVTYTAEQFPPKNEGWMQVYPKERKW